MSASQLPSRHAPPLPKAGRRVRGQESCDASVSRAQGNVTGPTRQSKRRVVKATTPQNGPFAHGSPGRRRSSIVCVWGRRSHNTHPPQPPAERGGGVVGDDGGRSPRCAPDLLVQTPPRLGFHTHRPQLLPGQGRAGTKQGEDRGRRECGFNAQRSGGKEGAGVGVPRVASPTSPAASAPS